MPSTTRPTVKLFFNIEEFDGWVGLEPTSYREQPVVLTLVLPTHVVVSMGFEPIFTTYQLQFSILSGSAGTTQFVLTEGVEPSYTITRLTHGYKPWGIRQRVVGLGEFESPTFRVSAECSNQLSYNPLVGLGIFLNRLPRSPPTAFRVKKCRDKH